MTVAELEATVASLRGFQTGLGLDEAVTRRIIVEVAAEGERDPVVFRDEVRLQMLDAAKDVD